MKTKKATYILVLFQPPGSPDSAAELKDLLPFLSGKNNFTPAGNCKTKTMTESMENATDYTFLQMMMITWLGDEGENIELIPTKFEIGFVGINVPDSTYEFFQAAWAMPLEKPKSWWQFWK